MNDPSISVSRWVTKKAARLLVGSVSIPLLSSPAHRNRLRVLTFHRFQMEARSPFSVASQILERRMSWLAAKNIAVPPQMAAEIAAGVRPQRQAIIVTIDDGHPSVIDNAAAIFARYSIPYAVYVIPGRIGRKDHMSKIQLRDLATRGAHIGSHSMTHRSVAGLPISDLTYELSDSKKAIEDIIGRSVTSFAYPFGTLLDFDCAAAMALRKAGYEFGFTSQHGAVTPGQDLMTLPRVKIEGGDPDWIFRAACVGALDQWRFIDRRLSMLQKPAASEFKRSVKSAA
jgi:peptidoglycan/xylan/chitin deacetylase (PgdA/CDA1 family)